MEIGIDSFAAMFSGNTRKTINDSDALAQLIERIERADQVGLEAVSSDLRAHERVAQCGLGGTRPR